MLDMHTENCLHRSINWRQGFTLALGIPLAILPTIGYTVSFLWSASILLWGLSVVQGFLQNVAFGELACAYPTTSGIPGFSQEVFKRKNEGAFGRGRLIGAFCAWAYWLAWAPGIAVFIIVISYYLLGIFPWLATVDQMALNLALSLLILGCLAFTVSKGLNYASRLGLIIAILTIVPIVIIVLVPFVTGNFDWENISQTWVPNDWTWDGDQIMLILGLMVIVQWSACSWEVVALYGPEYIKPSSDLPKALLVTGIYCLIMFVLIQVSVIGALGVDGVQAQPISPLQPLAEMAFGSIGTSIIIMMLIGAMILLIQMHYSVAARTLYSLSLQGNLPRWLTKINKNGEPMRAVFVVAIFNIFLILLGNPVAILAASAIGYVFAFAIGLFAYVKANRDLSKHEVKRPFKAPKGWVWIALGLGILQVPFLLIGATYINNLSYGLAPTLVGFGVLALFFPLWIYSRRKDGKNGKIAINIVDEIDSK